jgi:hypothetical protein
VKFISLLAQNLWKNETASAHRGRGVKHSALRLKRWEAGLLARFPKVKLREEKPRSFVPNIV